MFCPEVVPFKISPTALRMSLGWMPRWTTRPNRSEFNLQIRHCFVSLTALGHPKSLVRLHIFRPLCCSMERLCSVGHSIHAAISTISTMLWEEVPTCGPCEEHHEVCVAWDVGSKDQVIARPKTGSYTFQLDSDDGSRMFLEGAWKELRIFRGVLSLWLLLIVSFRELQIGVVVPQFLVLWFRNDSFQVSKSLIMHLGYKEDFCARRICTKRSWHQIPEKIEKIENSLWGRLQGNKPSWTGDTSEAI